jgi:hypothetical protein
MSAGKAAAQAAHAAALVTTGSNWKVKKDQPHRTVIVLESEDGNQLRNLEEYLKERKIKSHKVIDEEAGCHNHQITALATEILEKGTGDKLFAPYELFNTPPQYVVQQEYIPGDTSLVGPFVTGLIIGGIVMTLVLSAIQHFIK